MDITASCGIDILLWRLGKKPNKNSEKGKILLHLVPGRLSVGFPIHREMK